MMLYCFELVMLRQRARVMGCAARRYIHEDEFGKDFHLRHLRAAFRSEGRDSLHPVCPAHFSTVAVVASPPETKALTCGTEKM